MDESPRFPKEAPNIKVSTIIFNNSVNFDTENLENGDNQAERNIIFNNDVTQMTNKDFQGVMKDQDTFVEDF
jgi:hypothetical protein